MKKLATLGLVASIILTLSTLVAMGQEYVSLANRFSPERDDYFVGPDHTIQVQVQVWGEVNTPGLHLIREGSDVLEAISVAGGPKEEANLKQVTLFRRTGNPQVINLERTMTGKESSPVLQVEPGDMIRIPRKAKQSWRSVMDLVGDVTVLANIYYLVSRSR